MNANFRIGSKYAFLVSGYNNLPSFITSMVVYVGYNKILKQYEFMYGLKKYHIKKSELHYTQVHYRSTK